MRSLKIVPVTLNFCLFRQIIVEILGHLRTSECIVGQRSLTFNIRNDQYSSLMLTLAKDVAYNILTTTVAT